MRVLDLGCGKGITSIFLAKEYGVTVFAADLWISATDNYERIKSMGLEDKIIPIHAYDAAIKTIHENEYEFDELEAGGFTAELSTTVKAPL